MKKEQNIILKLLKHFKDSVFSRAAVINLFAVDLSNKKSIAVDFNNIEFISRSATHQFIKEKLRLENELNIKVTFLNQNKEVKTMFDIVNKSIESPQPKVSEIYRVRFASQKEFSNFLLRI